MSIYRTVMESNVDNDDMSDRDFRDVCRNLVKNAAPRYDSWVINKYEWDNLELKCTGYGKTYTCRCQKYRKNKHRVDC